MILFEDVNLDELKISPDGKDIFLKFIDMNAGFPVGVIKCSSVYSLNYQNIFDLDDGFSCYIGEVVCQRIEQNEFSSILKKISFSFSLNDQSFYMPKRKELFVLHAEGGEVVIDIVCASFEKL